MVEQPLAVVNGKRVRGSSTSHERPTTNPIIPAAVARIGALRSPPAG
jgi:hypothetical protein